MHEIGVCESLIDLIEQRAAGRPVAEVSVRIGARHAIVDEAFDQAFALAAVGTVAAGAEARVRIMPMDLECRGCGGRSESLDRLATCPGCGSAEVTLAGGEELVLESIRYAPTGVVPDVSGHPG
jgi:hydrogenase nickel incorporation protein HypA/HybF